MIQKEKATLERIEMDAKRHIHYFCEVAPDQITGRKYAIVRKNCFGQIIHRYTDYHNIEQLEIAVKYLILGMMESQNEH